MSSKQQLTTRIRNASVSLENRQSQITQLIDSNQITIQSQVSIINSLQSDKSLLMETKIDHQETLRMLMEKQHCLKGKLDQNMELKERIAELEGMIAKTNVNNAIKESEILDQQMRLGKLASLHEVDKKNSQRDKEQQEEQQKRRAKTRGILEESRRQIDVLEIKESYSDSDRKQWIKTLKINQSSKEETITIIKSKSKNLIKGFIPHDLRRLGWPLLIQNKLGLTPELYCHYYENRKVPEKVLFQIDKDIDRSFPNISDIQKDFPLQLKEIIEIFHCYRPDVSYVQGMTYPAGILLLVLDRYKAWECFCNLVLTTNVVYKMYVFDLENIALYCRTFDLLLDENQPKLSLVLKEENIHSEIYLIEWFYTMFSRSFSIPVVLKIWDLFLFFGESILYQVGLAIFEQISVPLMSLGYQESIELIRNFQSIVSQQKILCQLSSNKLPTDRVKEAMQKVIQQNNIPSKMS